jgi:two-component system, NtrC family, response regulator HydG
MGVLVEHVTVETARKNVTICVLDQDRAQAELSTGLLEGAGFTVVSMASPQEALERIRRGDFRVILAELKKPGNDGLEFLEKALECDPGLHVILMTEFYSRDSAVEAIKRGAYDYLRIPLDIERLERTLDDLAEAFSRRLEIKDQREKLLEKLQFQGIVGKSPAMIEVMELVRKVSRHYTNVLVSGETGVGKEPVARALHQLSPVAKERFAVCNCSAFVDSVLESQLFGHVRGAFAGAMEARPGIFEYANGGTVFLDEIGEISLPMQARLFGVIQNREIQTTGSAEVKKVDVRIITATNRDLRAEVLAGRFREDLLDRLSNVEIYVPRLDERVEDILVLARHFLRKYSQAYGKRLNGLSQRAQVALLQHDWPGNVRELENTISGAVIKAGADFIDVRDLPEYLAKPRPRAALRGNEWRPAPLHEVRRDHIQRVLEKCNGNRVRAAKMLGIGRTSLYRFLRRPGKQMAAARRGA